MLDERGGSLSGVWSSGRATVYGFVSVDVGSPLGIRVALRDGDRIVGTDTTYAASAWEAGYQRRTTGKYMLTGVGPGTYDLVFSLGGQEIARETVVVGDQPNYRRESSLHISGIHRTPRCA